MSVVLDSLLTMAPDNRQKAPQAREDKGPQERDNKEFSNLYARERANSNVENKPVAKRSEAPEPTKKTEPQNAKEPADDDAPVVSSGKDLPPADEVEPEPDNQALQWLGLAEELDESLPVAVDPAASGLPLAIPGMEAMLQEPVRVSLGMEKVQGQGMTSGLKLETAESQLKSLEVGEAQESLVLEQAPVVEGEPSADNLFTLKPLVEELSVQIARQAVSAEVEGVGETRAENLLNRLASLAPPVAGPTVTAKGIPLVPGQPVQMQQAGWSSAVVDKVMWLSSQNLKSAEIQLDPAELGRLDVRISLNQDVTQITFASMNAGVRDALESQMHRLRELFAQQGMNQLDVNVSDQSLQRGHQGAEQQASANSGRGSVDALGQDGQADVLSSGVLPLREGLGLVDYYA